MLEEFWGKSRGLDEPYPLLAHLLDTATMGVALWDKWLRPGLKDLLGNDLGENAREVCAWILGVHDIGKANPGFQFQGVSNPKHGESIREHLLNSRTITWNNDFSKVLTKNKWTSSKIQHHQVMSVWTLNGGSFPSATQLASPRSVAISALGHHGHFECVLKRDNAKETGIINEWFKPYGWLDVQQEMVEQVATALGIRIQLDNIQASPTSIILLSGLTVLADRLASNIEWVLDGQRLIKSQYICLGDPAGWIEKRYSNAVDHLERTVGIYHGWSSADAARQAILGEHSPRNLQQEAMKLDASFMIMNAMTGSGKTEAALLRHAQAPERLIFLLPTQATSNAIMKRVHKVFASTPNVAALAHGLASIEEFYTQPVSVGTDVHAEEGLYPTEFVKSGAQRLLAPVCVGTVDQALAAALPLKWTHLRLLGLANAHVVIDEVHTMDAYQSVLLKSVLNWLAAVNARVTLLSATMPKSQRDDLVAALHQPRLPGGNDTAVTLPQPQFPSIETLSAPSAPLVVHKLESEVRQIGIDLSSVEVKDDVTGHVRWFLQEREKFPHARIGVICNVVSRAQEVARLLRDNGESVLLLHARMTAGHRSQVSARLEATLGPDSTTVSTSVVGTQAIEASLDIDLDLLSTDLCPAPSLIQRAGRAWRRTDNKRTSRVPRLNNLQMRVQQLADAKWWQLMPYFEAELRKVSNWLSKHGEINLPGSSQDFLDSTQVSIKTLNDEDCEGATEQIANQLLKLQSAVDNRYSMDELLSIEATFSSFENMTKYSVKDADLDNLPTTRFVEQTANRVVVLGDSELIPGAWDGSPNELVELHGARDQETLKRVLQAAMPLGSQINEVRNFVHPLSGAKSVLAQYQALDLRGREREYYDCVLGYVGPRKE